jgi:hypothetical protein
VWAGSWDNAYTPPISVGLSRTESENIPISPYPTTFGQFSLTGLGDERPLYMRHILCKTQTVACTDKCGIAATY